jgi:hypothetical protein
VAGYEETIRPFAESVLEPGEELRGACVASQQTTFRGWMVLIAVTEDRLVVQRLKKAKQLEAEGPPLRLGPTDIVAAKTGSSGDEFANPTIAVVEALAITLQIKTTAGEKLKLMISRGGAGNLGRMGGGETQAAGVAALGHWFQRAGAGGAT